MDRVDRIVFLPGVKEKKREKTHTHTHNRVVTTVLGERLKERRERERRDETKRG